jgi:SAM-dependent methyltransferase
MIPKNDQEYLNKSLQQFESSPYPNIPIEAIPKDNVKLLYENSLVTAKYRQNGTVLTELKDKLILDVACGTGITTLNLALANPEARIVGIDISPESIKIAKDRLTYHGFADAEFHVLAIEDLGQLEQEFDLINASEVLYLLPDLTEALICLRQILKPDGIIRANLHSYYQRFNFYRSQELFRLMGLMDENPEKAEITFVRDFFDCLKDNVDLKNQTWQQQHRGLDDQWVLCNHLLQNDQGFTFPQLINSLEIANLQLFDMVNWPEWNWRRLFKENEDLPAYLGLMLEGGSLEDQLCFYELVQPNKRLLDFWCGHPTDDEKVEKDWLADSDEEILVHINPNLKTEAFCYAILEDASLSPINPMQFFPFLHQDSWLDRTLMRAVYAPLLDSEKQLSHLVDKWLALYPVDPTTMRSTARERAASIIRLVVEEHEAWGLLMLERKKI